MNIVEALGVLVEVKGIQQSARGIDQVDESLRGAERSAIDATREVQQFGRTRGTATASLDTAGFQSALADARRDLASIKDIRIDADAAQAQRKVAAVKRDLAGVRDKTVNLRVDTGSGGGGIRDLTRDLHGLGGAAVGPTATLGGFRIALAVLIPTAIALSGALFAVASALAPIVGLAASAGSALTAAAQGFGVFKLASMGVIDALKEQISVSAGAGARAAEQAGQERAAARAIQSAQEGVRAARENVRQATDQLSEAVRRERQAIDAIAPAYREARRHLQDMRVAVTDTALAFREAQLEARSTRRALAELLAGPSPRILAEAYNTLVGALRGGTTASRELEKAWRALNDLMAPPAVLDVADAKDRVSDALRGQERAALDLAAQTIKTNAILASPGSGEAARAQAVLDLADAQNAVGDAARDVARAQGDLNKLMAPPDLMAVADAQARIGDAQAGVHDATMATRDAFADLVAIQTPASLDDIATAILAIAMADQAVVTSAQDATRAARDYAAAQRAGISGAPEVVAAREDIRAATKAVADAERNLANSTRQVALAQQAVRDAQLDAAESSAAAAEGAAKLNEKFNSLPPAAQKFVRVLEGMKPKLDELRETAAQGFFPGATEGLEAAARNFDSVKVVVGETSTVLGDLARRAGELVGSPAFGRDIEEIGGRNAKVIDTLGGALLHVTSAIRHVLIAAGPLTQWLADVIKKWALQTAVAAKAGRENGKLAEFFEKTKEVLQRVGSIISNVVGGLRGLGEAGTKSGKDILESIDKAAKRFNEWANDKENQDKIKQFFEDSRKFAAAFGDVVAGVTKGIALMTLRVLPLSTAMKALGPYVDEVTVAYIAYKVATIAATVAQKALNIAMLTSIGRAFAWRVALLAAAAASGVATAAQWLLNTAMLANPIGIVVIAIAALVAAFFLLGGKLSWLGDAFTWLWDRAKEAWEWIKDNWSQLVVIIAGPIGDVVELIGEHWGTIKQATSDAWNWVKTAISNAWNFIKDVVSDAVSAVAGAVSGAWNAIKSATTLAWDAVTGALSSAWTFIRESVSNGVEAVRTAITKAWDAVKDATTSVWDTVKEAIGKAVRGALDKVRDLVGDFVGVGRDIVEGIAKGIYKAAKSVVDAITDVVGSVVKKAKGILGSNSPSRVFADIGQDTGMGFILGIQGQIGAAQRAISSLVAPPLPALAAAGATPVAMSRSGGAPMGGGGVTVMGDLVVRDREDANVVAARLAWLAENG